MAGDAFGAVGGVGQSQVETAYVVAGSIWLAGGGIIGAVFCAEIVDLLIWRYVCY
jgi:hypothetical protein